MANPLPLMAFDLSQALIVECTTRRKRMTTQAENDRLTQIGPSTPMGNLLRRYWHPVGTEADLLEEPVQRVRWFGEDLTLFRTERGDYGLVEDRCPHRR